MRRELEWNVYGQTICETVERGMKRGEGDGGVSCRGEERRKD